MAELIQNIVIVVGLIAVGIIGYFMWLETQSSNEATAIDQQALSSAVILRQIAALREIELNDAVLRDPAFNQLQSYRPTITPVTVGNSNPFAR